MDLCIFHPASNEILKKKIKPNIYVQYYYKDNSSVTFDMKNKTIMYYDHNYFPLYDKWREVAGEWEKELYEKAVLDTEGYQPPFNRCPIQ